MIGIPFFDEWDYLDHHEAQLFAGQNLPLNKRYLLCEGRLFRVVIFLDHCGYCFDYGDEEWKGYAKGYWDDELETSRGVGCPMCSHTGLRADYSWIPFFMDPDDIPF